MTKIWHSLYMDDFKLIGKMEKELQEDIQRVKTYADEQHGFHKCEQTVLKEHN